MPRTPTTVQQAPARRSHMRSMRPQHARTWDGSTAGTPGRPTRPSRWYVHLSHSNALPRTRPAEHGGDARQRCCGHWARAGARSATRDAPPRHVAPVGDATWHSTTSACSGSACNGLPSPACPLACHRAPGMARHLGASPGASSSAHCMRARNGAAHADASQLLCVASRRAWLTEPKEPASHLCDPSAGQPLRQPGPEARARKGSGPAAAP